MRKIIVFLLLLAVAGCGGGPDRDTLRKDISERIAEALPDSTVTLVDFARRGSQADVNAPVGETRRIVYFDAKLKVDHDFEFGAWDKPGVAGLVSALGAGPKGITGIESGGNKTGDIISAHGRALYKRDAAGWSLVTTGGYQPAEAPAYATNTPLEGPAATLDAMRKVIDSVSKESAPAQVAVIQEELSAAYAAIRARLARMTDGYAIAAGAEQGQYLRFAQALSSKEGPRIVALVTRGGEDNVDLLRSGKAALALAQGDSALEAYEGKGNFSSSGPYTLLRAIGSLYPEPVHVLVRTDSSATSVSDLRGLRVAIGEQGSASRTTALRILQAHGLGTKDITPAELSLGDALVALKQKKVDAIIQIIGVPADSIRDALSQVPMRLLPLSQAAIASMSTAKTGYFPYTIAHGSYASQKQDVKTIATAALLLAAPDLSDAEVGDITRFVFAKGRDFAGRGSAQGVQVSLASARLGLSVPLHTTAAKTLDSMGAPATAIPSPPPTKK